MWAGFLKVLIFCSCFSISLAFGLSAEVYAQSIESWWDLQFPFSLSVTTYEMSEYTHENWRITVEINYTCAKNGCLLLKGE